MSMIGLPTNSKHSLVPLPSDNFAAQPSVTDQRESPLRSKKVLDVFSVAANSLNKFIITIVIQFFETSELTLLNW